MNKFAFVIAALATVTLAGTAHADRDNQERAAWAETVRSQSSLDFAAPVVIEGRNAATYSVAEVEPYIAQSIEQNSRSR